MTVKRILFSLLLGSAALISLGGSTSLVTNAATSDAVTTTSATTDTSFASTAKRLQDNSDRTVQTIDMSNDHTYVRLNDNVSPILYDEDGAPVNETLPATNRIYQICTYVLDLNTHKIYLQEDSSANGLSAPDNYYFEFNPDTMALGGKSADQTTFQFVTDPITFNFQPADIGADDLNPIGPAFHINSGLDTDLSSSAGSIAYSGYLRNELFNADGSEIPGYYFNTSSYIDFDSDKNSFILYYTKDDTPSTVPTNPNSNSTSSPSNTASSISSSSSSSDKVPSQAKPFTDFAVYATKKIGLYNSPNFSKATRKFWYTKQTRTKRPQFVVIGYARNKAGILRYKVRDVNRRSKTFKQRGYITTNATDVSNTYYLKNPRTVRVIGAKGVNAYTHINLSGKDRRHFKHGSILKVKALKTYHLTTRLLLNNGQYVTANKTLVLRTK
ncbi:DUF5776 domain-containing protein [Levilactobacillus humaensis]|uniref:DUF5776 domain-containing protein n=1 Tax=Levilactobacillus humaensis TaxID=2950375 RepID=UPI0021C33F25|nr:DUF5776 domain-containing protein [Levilactobacillus humaensis]